MNINLKKYQSTLIILSFLLIPSGALAGEVTSTFSPGGTLTSTQMNEIKGAVNDNDTRIFSKQNEVTGTCPAGESIRVINVDGTVVCQPARSVISVIKASADIGVGSFGCASAICPVSHPIAIGGGVDPNNVLSMQISGSNPIIDGTTRISILADGEYPAPNGWAACAVNNGGSPQALATVAICSDQ